MWSPLTQLNQVALLMIDLQELDVDPQSGALASEPPEVVSAYLNTISSRVLPNAGAVLKTARALSIEVIHVRIQSLTRDGRDRSRSHKRLGLHVPPGSPLAQFLPEVAPTSDEIILNKTSSDAFHTTSLAHILRSIGISQLLVCGVFTHECVSSTVRSACDLGFEVRVIREACAAVTQAQHQTALEDLDQRYAQVVSAEELITALYDAHRS